MTKEMRILLNFVRQKGITDRTLVKGLHMQHNYFQMVREGKLKLFLKALQKLPLYSPIFIFIP